MDAGTLFNLGFDHWQAFLLAFIPAMITLGAVIYFSGFPATKVNRIYLLYLISIFAWQMNESFSRLSLTLETAQFWDRLFVFVYLIQFPSWLHCVLLLTGKKKLANNSWFVFILYFPAFFFAMLLCGGLYSQSFTYSSFWGWVRTFNGFISFQTIPMAWVCALTFFPVIILASFAYKNRRSPETRFISLFIFTGYTIPLALAVTTEIAFPLFFHTMPVPLSSLCMLGVVIVLSQLIAYKIFNLSETIKTERITEIIQEAIFVISHQRNITYINPYGVSVAGIKGSGIKKLKDLFPNSPHTYNSFEKKVIVPAFEKDEPANFRFWLEDKNGKELHWQTSTYPIFNRKNIDGLLVMCRDITDQVLMAETKLMALRSQMNPHFIFNSLNSIQHYIHSNKREEAESFLSVFSTLIRQILDNSDNAVISLFDEVNTINLYLQLEKARLAERLTYEVNIDADVDPDDTMVPSMLIQPYIENAILHGLNPKDAGGSVFIQIKKGPDWIICTIKDDGIGREKALEIKNRRKIKKKSYGLSITQTRLEILNKQLNIPVTVKIVDLYNEQGFAAGTQVEIYIPLQERF